MRSPIDALQLLSRRGREQGRLAGRGVEEASLAATPLRLLRRNPGLLYGTPELVATADGAGGRRDMAGPRLALAAQRRLARAIELLNLGHGPVVLDPGVLRHPGCAQLLRQRVPPLLDARQLLARRVRLRRERVAPGARRLERPARRDELLLCRPELVGRVPGFPRRRLGGTLLDDELRGGPRLRLRRRAQLAAQVVEHRGGVLARLGEGRRAFGGAPFLLARALHVLRTRHRSHRTSGGGVLRRTADRTRLASLQRGGQRGRRSRIARRLQRRRAFPRRLGSPARLVRLALVLVEGLLLPLDLAGEPIALLGRFHDRGKRGRSRDSLRGGRGQRLEWSELLLQPGDGPLGRTEVASRGFGGYPHLPGGDTRPAELLLGLGEAVQVGQAPLQQGEARRESVPPRGLRLGEAQRLRRVLQLPGRALLIALRLGDLDRAGRARRLGLLGRQELRTDSLGQVRPRQAFTVLRQERRSSLGTRHLVREPRAFHEPLGEALPVRERACRRPLRRRGRLDPHLRLVDSPVELREGRRERLHRPFAEHLRLPRAQLLARRLERILPRAEVLLDLAVERGPEELLHQLLALVCGRAQQPLEVTLREQDHLRELLHPQPEQLGDLLRDGGGLRREWLALAVLAQGGGGRFRREAVAPPLRALPRRGALDDVLVPAEPEAEGDPRRDAVGGAIGAKPRQGGRSRPRDVAVERERHRVEERGLPGAGGAVDEEEIGGAERREVDPLGARVRPERLEREGERSHRSRRPITPTEVLESVREDAAVLRPGQRARDALEEAVEERLVVVARLRDATCELPLPGGREHDPVDVQHVPIARLEPVLGVDHVAVVLQRRLDEVSLVPGQILPPEQILELAPDPHHVPPGADREHLAPSRSGLHLGEHDPLGLVGLGERVLEEGARVADARAHLLGRVQVPERDVVEPFEAAGGHDPRATDGARALALGGRDPRPGRTHAPRGPQAGPAGRDWPGPAPARAPSQRRDPAASRHLRGRAPAPAR